MAPEVGEFESGARELLAAIEKCRLHTRLLQERTPAQGRQLALAHTKLDEARLWLQDAIGYER